MESAVPPLSLENCNLASGKVVPLTTTLKFEIFEIYAGIFNKQLKFCLFVCNRGDTILYYGRLQSRELGQVPMLLVFLTPR